MRLVTWNRHGEVVTDRFNDAESSAFENAHGSGRVLVLRDKHGKSIASFDEARVIKCLSAEPAQPDEAEHLRALLREAIGLMPLGTRLRADWVERALKTLNPL